MASILTTTAQAAHSAAASLLSAAQIQVGGVVPPEPVKEEEATKSEPLPLTGINVIVGVPGAFTGTCSAQVPGYIQTLDQFKAKGVQNVFVVAVNDVFVTKAWKEQLAPNGTGVRFIADDTGAFTSKLGLVLDATPLLGAPRSKRYVIVANGDKVQTLAIEEDPSKVTITDAKTILAQL
ncbi:hypothetical protein HGRIS_010773 [Hohenbuehelia grisea]|uniref:Redoxin domain-containing protein n=1 Tax=Hohenbuehelia grisea TaxID=104357 RepID=A0ABR3IXS5_9AGAR